MLVYTTDISHKRAYIYKIKTLTTCTPSIYMYKQIENWKLHRIQTVEWVIRKEYAFLMKVYTLKNYKFNNFQKEKILKKKMKPWPHVHVQYVYKYSPKWKFPSIQTVAGVIQKGYASLMQTYSCKYFKNEKVKLSSKRACIYKNENTDY